MHTADLRPRFHFVFKPECLLNALDPWSGRTLGEPAPPSPPLSSRHAQRAVAVDSLTGPTGTWDWTGPPHFDVDVPIGPRWPEFDGASLPLGPGGGGGLGGGDMGGGGLPGVSQSLRAARSQPHWPGRHAPPRPATPPLPIRRTRPRAALCGFKLLDGSEFDLTASLADCWWRCWSCWRSARCYPRSQVPWSRAGGNSARRGAGSMSLSVRRLDSFN